MHAVRGKEFGEDTLNILSAGFRFFGFFFFFSCLLHSTMRHVVLIFWD